MKSLLIKVLITTLLVGNFYNAASAHEEVAEDPVELIHRFGILFDRLSTLEVVGDLEEAKPTAPVLNMGGKKIYANRFFSLTEAVLQDYRNNISELCPDCKVPSAVEINTVAKGLVAKGWLSQTAGKVGKGIAIRYGSEFIDLAARYGAMAGVLKVAGELAEDALLVVFKMPNAHFLCEVITLGITLYSGTVLTTYRTWANAGALGKNGTMQLVRLAATSWAAKRSFRRMNLEVGPVEISPELLDSSRERSPSQEWLVEEFGEDKRYEEFLNRIVEKRRQYDAEIAAVEAQMKTAPANKHKALTRRWNRLQNKVADAATVSRKVFEARRLGLTLYIFKRNRAKTLYTNEMELNRFVRGTNVWMAAMTAPIANAGLSLSNNLASSPEFFWESVKRSSNAPNSEISDILLEEARQHGMRSEVLSSLFADVDSIFDTSLTRRERYARLMMMEGFISEFLPRLRKSYISMIRDEYINKGISWEDIKKISRLQWNMGTTTYHTDLFMDYLRSAALTRGKSRLYFEADHAKDFLVQFFTTFETMAKLGSALDGTSLDELNKEVRKKVDNLEIHEFWKEKKATHSVLPIGQFLAWTVGLGQRNYFRKRPACARLYY